MCHIVTISPLWSLTDSLYLGGGGFSMTGAVMGSARRGSEGSEGSGLDSISVWYRKSGVE